MIFAFIYLWNAYEKTRDNVQEHPYSYTQTDKSYENQYYNENYYYPYVDAQRRANQVLALFLLCSGAVAAGGVGLYVFANLPRLFNSLGSGYDHTRGYDSRISSRSNISFPKYHGYPGGSGRDFSPDTKETKADKWSGYDSSMPHPDDIKKFKG